MSWKHFEDLYVIGEIQKKWLLINNFVKNKEELYNIRRVWLEKEKKIKFNNGLIKQLLVDK